MPEEERRSIGEAARRRVLAGHTAACRASELETSFSSCTSRTFQLAIGRPRNGQARRRTYKARALDQRWSLAAGERGRGTTQSQFDEKGSRDGRNGVYRLASLCEVDRKGCFVYCLDNNYSRVVSKIFGTGSIILDFEFLHQDVSAISSMCDRIYNLACPASPVHYQAEPIRDDADQCPGRAPAALGENCGARFCNPRPARFMATPAFIPRRNSTGETSIR